MERTTLLLSRVQFAFMVSFQIIFPSLPLASSKTVPPDAEAPKDLDPMASGFRARPCRVLLFDPTNAESVAYSQLVPRGEWEVRDVQNVADVLGGPEELIERRNHWEKTRHVLPVSSILHVLYAEPGKTLAGVAKFPLRPKTPD
jgi:type IV secretory pathway TraG/TraD family ATPase VirD4